MARAAGLDAASWAFGLLLWAASASAGDPLYLGMCGSRHEFFWPAVFALTKKSFESGDPILPLTGTTPLNISWVMPYAADTVAETENGLKLMMGTGYGKNVSWPPVNGIVGCTTSSVSDTVASFAVYFQAVMVSWVSGGDELSNKLVYPYFLRTRSGGAVTGVGMVKVFKLFNWTRVGYMYEDYSFHQGIFSAALNAGKPIGIEVVGFKLFYALSLATFNIEYWRSTMTDAVQSPYKVFGCGMQYDRLELGYRLAYNLTLNSRVFILAQGFADKQPAWAADLKVAWNGAMGIDAAQSANNAISAKMDQQWSKMSYAEMRTMNFVDSRYIDLMNASSPNLFGKSVFNTYHAHQLDAVMAFLIAFQQLLDAGVPAADIRGKKLLDKLYNVTFVGASGPVAFTPVVNGVGGDRADLPMAVHQAKGGKPVQVMLVTASVQILDKFVFPDGSSDPSNYLPPVQCPQGMVRTMVDGGTVCKPCPAGQAPTKSGDACVDCPASTYAPAGSTNCFPCLAGSYNNKSGAGQCLLCTKGTFSGNASSTACIDCPLGSAAAEDGMSECSICPVGFFMPHTDAVECLPCASGTYQPDLGQTACVSCEGELPGSITLLQAASKKTACVCPASTYTAFGHCASCTEGMLCDEPGLMDPKQAGGYQVKVLRGSDGNRSYSVYRCASALECPAGPADECAEGQTGTACGKCLDGYFRKARGNCKVCEKGDVTPIIISLIAVAVFIILLFVYTMNDGSKDRMTLVTAVLAAGQLICAVQALGIIDQIKINFAEPVAAMLSIGNFFAFDIDMLKVQCVVGKDSPVANFVIRLIALPVVACMLGVVMALGGAVKLRLKGSGHGRGVWGVLDLDRFVNAVGLLTVIVYVSITISMLRPLHCTQHPNGMRSMSSNPSVLCWQGGEHTALVAMGILGLLCYPVALLARITLVTWSYHDLVASGKGLQTLQRFRFLFARFRPDRHYWGFWYLLRNLCLSLVPVIIPDSGIGQTMLLAVLFLMGLVSQALLMPWRTPLANVSELASLAGLVLFMQASAFLVQFNATETVEMVCNLLLSIAIIVFASVIAISLWGMYRYFFPGGSFAMFLSHHKEGAGSLARWFKLQVVAICRLEVFLDSDHLEELDLIVETVRSRTKNLVVLLTGKTLTRPWCGAEIQASVTNKIPIVQVACDDYVKPDTEFLAMLDDLWSEQQKLMLAQFGITVDQIREAYRHMVTLPLINLERFSCVSVQREAVLSVLKACKYLGAHGGHTHVPDTTATKGPARILISGASYDAEARTTCEVLKVLVQNRTEMPTMAVHSVEEADPHMDWADYLLAVLTRGVLQDAAFQDIAVGFSVSGRPTPVRVVTCLADTNFAFPSPDALDIMEQESERGMHLVAHLRRVFNVLALPFSPHGSMGIIETQIAQMCRYFKETCGVPATMSSISPRSVNSLPKVDGRGSSAAEPFKGAHVLDPDEIWGIIEGNLTSI